MSRWRDVAAAEPGFARRVLARLNAHRHKVIASLRKDGSPRISGIEVQFVDGEIVLGMMKDSRKARDVLRDPRIALHSGTEDPSETPGELIDAKISGRAVEVAAEGHHLFHVDIDEVVLISLGDPADHLVIDRWTPAEGLVSVKRY